MVKNINEVLQQAKIDKRTNTPPTVLDIENESFRVVCEVLRPLASLTDTLQGDNITSSLAIPGLLTAMTRA